jgi:hypothetical protein
MELLLHDQMAPITSEIGFLQAETSEVVSAYMDWMRSLQQLRDVTLLQTTVLGNLERVLQSLLPLTSHEPRHVLFVPTANGWTAYFDNLYRGTDSTSTLAVLTARLSCTAIRSAAVPNTIHRTGTTLKGRYGAVIFEVYGSNQTEGPHRRRLVQVINDGGKWIFDSLGTPFSFESIVKYRLWPIRNRFTVEMLAAYLENFGVDAFNQAYYMPLGSAAVLVARQGPIPKGLREYTLSEARTDYE